MYDQTTNEPKATVLRRALEDGLVEAPGAHDALSARLVQEFGYPALYLGGMALAAVGRATADIGILSPNDLVALARPVIEAADLPVILDLDNGGGNPYAVAHAVRTAEAAGVAAVHIEDVDYSHGKHLLAPSTGAVDPSSDRLLPLPDALTNLHAALEARTNPDTIVIARSDAIATTGLDAAIERAHAFATAGADMVFLPYLRLDDVRTVADSVECPLVLFPVEAFDQALKTKLADAGVGLLIHPSPGLLPAYAATRAVLEELTRAGTLSQSNGTKELRRAFRHSLRWPSRAPDASEMS